MSFPAAMSITACSTSAGTAFGTKPKRSSGACDQSCLTKVPSGFSRRAWCFHQAHPGELPGEKLVPPRPPPRLVFSPSAPRRATRRKARPAAPPAALGVFTKRTPASYPEKSASRRAPPPYFTTATVKGWKHLLKPDKYKRKLSPIHSSFWSKSKRFGCMLLSSCLIISTGCGNCVVNKPFPGFSCA